MRNFKEQAMSKTAEQEWRNHIKKEMNGYTPESKPTLEEIESFIRCCISDYKQALRQAIEKDMNDLELSTNDYWHGYKHGLRTVLELLDTVTPTKE